MPDLDVKRLLWLPSPSISGRVYQDI